MHPKQEVLNKSLAMSCIGISKAPANYDCQFFAFEKTTRQTGNALINPPVLVWVGGGKFVTSGIIPTMVWRKIVAIELCAFLLLLIVQFLKTFY